MVPVKYHKTSPFGSINSLFESLLDDDFFKATPQSMPERTGNFAADIYEKDGAYVIKADMPGVDKEDVSIELKEGILTITAKKLREKEIKDENMYRRERFSGTFKRSFNLSDNIDQDGIRAGMKDGVLEVTLPHGEKREVRQITVN
jgi:HSP20 family protein